MSYGREITQATLGTQQLLETHLFLLFGDCLLLFGDIFRKAEFTKLH